MREPKIPALASNANYATGPRTGQPTKIIPPVGNFTDGKIPDAKFAAQWQNYIESNLQRQVERSAQLPFLNFVDVAPFVTTTEIDITSGGGPVFLAHNKHAGITMSVAQLQNKCQYLQEVLQLRPADDHLPWVTLVGSSGNVFPRCIVAVEDPARVKWIVGVGTADNTKAIHEINEAGTPTEVTLPTGAPVECLAVDSATGVVYGLVADANNSVIVRNMTSGVWTVAGTRGAGAVAPVAGTMFFAVHNGSYVIAVKSTNLKVEYGTLSTFTRTLLTIASDTSDVLDVKYNVAMGAWMLLTKLTLRTFVDPAGAMQTWRHDTNDPTTGLAVNGGCLTSTGVATWIDSKQCVYVRDWPGSDAHVHHYGQIGTGGCVATFLKYDGSALWFHTDRTSIELRLYRTLRA